MMWSSRPVSNNSSNPFSAFSPQIILVSSSRIRSFEIFFMSWALGLIALYVSGWYWKLKLFLNLTALSSRRWSSLMRSSGSPMNFTSFSSMSFWPPR